MSPSLLRTFLILGRVSNLPTVWSNCLAGWWLGGSENSQRLPLLFVGVSLLYLGGMFLNDAFDVEFDRQFRQERPIPSGAISLALVYRWGLIWLGLGATCLILIGVRTGALGIVLLLAILLYDAIHKQTRLAPVLMGLCRFLVYLIAASVAAKGVTGLAIWSGLALACYIVGLSFFARTESAPGPLRYAPAIGLAAPVVLAQIINVDGYREAAILLTAVLVLWILRALRQASGSAAPNIGRMVSLLLAGIVFVDWLAVVDAPRSLGFVFIALFLAALFLQRAVPAT